MSSQRFMFSLIAIAMASHFSVYAVDNNAAAKATAKLSQPAAQSAAPVKAAPAKKLFSQAELDQMLAPVALYPDTVLSHVLIAATYPLEIIKATRWLASKSGMTSEQSLKAAENEPWDPSVRALVAFPPLLTKMNNELEWTQKLGDAFLIQEKQVMATVQRLREKAYTAGNLKNQEHIRVERKEKVIVIEPARPEVVYVPVYDTRVVYGDWWWRAYPPIHWPYPDRYSRSTFYWGAGVQVTPVFYSSTFYWPSREIVVIHHHHRPTRYYRSYDIVEHSERRHWRHNPQHRHGVVYHESYEPVRESYGGGPVQNYDDQEERRRWAAERRIDNQVGTAADQQLVREASLVTEQTVDSNATVQPGGSSQVISQENNQSNGQVVEQSNGSTQITETVSSETPVADSNATTVESTASNSTEQTSADPAVQTVPNTQPDAPADYVSGADSAIQQQAELNMPTVAGSDSVSSQTEHPQIVEPQPEMQSQPEPVYQSQEPVYQQAESQPEPVYQQPEPQPDPIYQQQEPVYQQPEPSYQAPEPSYQAPEPVYQQPEPSYQAPEPSYQAPEPSYQQPEQSTGNQF